MDDTLYLEILNYHNVIDKKYPDHIYEIPAHKRNGAKSNFRRKASAYYSIEGVLMFANKEVLTRSRVPAILNAYHDNPTGGGHFGRDRTYSKISERYYWFGMKTEIDNYIKRCKICFAVNPKIKKESEPLHSISVPTLAWSLVGIDIIGPCQETSSGNKYIVAATDHFTKYTEAAGIPDKSALSVANFIYTITCRLGCMDTIITDQGKEFVNEIMTQLTNRMGVEHRITSAYHPQTNGQRERDNRTLKDSLNKVANEYGNDWDFYIPGEFFSYLTQF